MSMAVIIAVFLCVGLFGVSLFTLKGFSWSVKSMTRIGVVSGVTIVLYMIKLVPFPQGGGCSLLSILPIMLLAVLYGKQEALFSAIVVALLKVVLAPPYFIMQLPLDYFGAMMAVAYVPMFGTDKKSKLLAGAITAAALSTFFSILSGTIFFGQYAPEGMNPWLYATVYNVLGYGVEASLSIVVLLLIAGKFKTKLTPEVV